MRLPAICVRARGKRDDMTEKQGDTGKYGKIMEVTGANMGMLCRQYMDELSQIATSRQPKQSSTN